MSEARIGRILVASLHQAIADLLPTRLDFYEHWLNPRRLRGGTLGLAAMTAVLSFLRGEEGGAYDLVVARAGEYAVDWSWADIGLLRRWWLMRLPARWRLRAALRRACTGIRRAYPGSRAILRRRRGTTTIEVRGSLFCEVRDPGGRPALCGFYLALVRGWLTRLRVPADAEIAGCRARGARTCRIEVRRTTEPVEPRGGRA